LQINSLNFKISQLIIVLCVASFIIFDVTEIIAAPVLQNQDIAVINSPSEGETVRGLVQIIGSADHPTFEFYVIDISPNNTENWQFLADGRTRIINGVLLNWDTAGFPDGQYKLRLRVVKVDGNYSEAFAQEINIINSQPLPTITPIITTTTTITPTPVATKLSLTETPTNTPIPPTATPTVLIEQPIVDTPTPRPTGVSTTPEASSDENEDKDNEDPFSIKVQGISFPPLRDAFLYGAGAMLSIFILFGFLSTLRIVFQGFIDNRNKKTGFGMKGKRHNE
jgi:hypothetical protein